MIPSLGAAINYYQPSIQNLSFDLDNMLKEARIYANSKGGVLGRYSNEDQLYDCIQKILLNGEFQADPKAYLQRMRQERGRAENVRWPEDYARKFLQSQFEKGG